MRASVVCGQTTRADVFSAHANVDRNDPACSGAENKAGAI